LIQGGVIPLNYSKFGKKNVHMDKKKEKNERNKRICKMNKKLIAVLFAFVAVSSAFALETPEASKIVSVAPKTNEEILSTTVSDFDTIIKKLNKDANMLDLDAEILEEQNIRKLKELYELYGLYYGPKQGEYYKKKLFELYESYEIHEIYEMYWSKYLSDRCSLGGVYAKEQINLLKEAYKEAKKENKKLKFKDFVKDSSKVLVEKKEAELEASLKKQIELEKERDALLETKQEKIEAKKKKIEELERPIREKEWKEEMERVEKYGIDTWVYAENLGGWVLMKYMP
jgi:hypothetical protein